ncbi:MAG: hypothetical protein WAO08_00285 [Hyphomicrobiaceae bacterium]
MMLPAKLPSPAAPLILSLTAAALLIAPAAQAKSRNTIGTIIGVGAAGAILNEAAKAMGQKPPRPGTASPPGGPSSSDTPKRNADPDAAVRAARQLAEA